MDPETKYEEDETIPVRSFPTLVNSVKYDILPSLIECHPNPPPPPQWQSQDFSLGGQDQKTIISK